MKYKSIKILLVGLLIFMLFPTNVLNTTARSIVRLDDEIVETSPNTENVPDEETSVVEGNVEEVTTTSLNTVHIYMDGDSQFQEEIVIHDLQVGNIIKTMDYIQLKEGYSLLEVSQEQLELMETDNTVTFKYEYLPPIDEPKINDEALQDTEVDLLVSAFSSNTDPGAVFYEKTATWVDESKGEARIDFSVFGNSIEKPSDILLILDTSGSIVDNNRVDSLKEAVIEFSEKIYGFNPNNRIMSIQFNSSASEIGTGFKSADANETLYIAGGATRTVKAKDFYSTALWGSDSKSISFTGNTNYNNAIDLAVQTINKRESKTNPVFIVFMSDGMPDSPEVDGKSKIDALRNLGVVYTVGLEVGSEIFNNNLLPLATNSSNDFAYNVSNKSDLASIYNKIANEISIAGTNAIIKDVINDDVFEVMVDEGGKARLEASIGTAEYDPLTSEVTWNVGNISEERQTLSIYIKIKDGNVVTGIVDTNKEATLTYDDYNGDNQSRAFDKPKLTIGQTGLIHLNYYLVNENGKLIDQANNQIPDTNFQKRVSLLSDYFTQNGKADLGYASYTITPPATINVGGKTYEYVPDAVGATSATSTLFVLSPINKQINLFYGYKESTLPATFVFTVEYYLQNADSTYTKQTAETGDTITKNYVPNEEYYANDYIKIFDNYTYAPSTTESINKINSEGTLGTTLKLYYTRTMEEILYTVNHKVNDLIVPETYKTTIWTGTTEKKLPIVVGSLNPKITDAFIGYVIDTISPNFSEGTLVTDKTIITINYKKDVTDLSYTIQDYIEGTHQTGKDYIGTEMDVWVNDPQVVQINHEEIRANQTNKYPGYSLSHYELADGTVFDLDNMDKIAAGTIVKAIYVPKSLQYKVNYLFNDGKTDLVINEQLIGNADFNTKIKTIDVQKDLTAEGYKLDHSDKTEITILENENLNVINIYYTKIQEIASYTIIERVAGIDKNTYVGEESVWIKEINKTISVKSDALQRNSYQGYVFEKYVNENNPTEEYSLTVGSRVPKGTTLIALYKAIDVGYTVHYWNKETNTEIFTSKSAQAPYRSEIVAENEKISIPGYVYDSSDSEFITIALDSKMNIINLYYYVDIVGDKDIDNKDISDGIADIYQVRFNYEVKVNGTGFVTNTNKVSEYEYVTRYDTNNKYSQIAQVSPMAKDIVGKPAAGYKFVQWIDLDGNVYNTTDEIRIKKFDGEMTFVAMFEKLSIPTPTPTPTPTPSPQPPTISPEEIPEPIPTVKPTGSPPPKPTMTTKPTATPTVEVVTTPEPTAEAVVIPVGPSDTPKPPAKSIGEFLNIDADAVPLAGILGNGRSWALVNLIVTIIGLIFTVILALSKREDDIEPTEEELNQNPEMENKLVHRKRIYRVLGIIVTVIALIVFFLTENILLPMVIVDSYTILMIFFMIVNIVIYFIGRRWHKVKNEEQEIQSSDEMKISQHF